MVNEALNFHILGSITFTLLIYLHAEGRTADQKRARWLALCSLCAIALMLTLKMVLGL